jgi:hypothetical protein
MPRQQRQRHLGSVLGILALVGAALGPLAAPASAAALYQQDGDGPSTAIIVAIDEPTHRSGTTASRVNVRGWAANPASMLGTGVARVDLYLDGGPDSGGQYLGRATYGRQRVDVAEALGGSRFLATGWDIVVDIPRGPHTLVAVAAPTGPETAVVIPGVASVRAVIGGPSGRTVVTCGAGGYCTSMEGGLNNQSGNTQDAMYQGNAYVSYGTYGFGPTTPQYGWWDALLPDLVPYLVAYAASAYPGPQSFFGHNPPLYDQNLLTAQSTLGVLGRPGGCSGVWNYAGLGPLGLSALGGYSYAFPFISGIGSSTAVGLPTAINGNAFGNYAPMSVPFSGSIGLGATFASGITGAWNGSPLGSIANVLNGSAIGVAGAGGAISSSYGGFYPGSSGNVNGDNFISGGCTQRL